MRKNHAFNLFVIMLLVVAFVPARQVALAQTSAADQLDPGAQFVPGELVISFAKGSSPAIYTQRAHSLASGLGGQVTRQYENSALLSFTPNASMETLIRRIFSFFPDVAVQPNYVYRLPEKDGQLQGAAPIKSSAALSRLSTADLLSLRSGSTIAGSPAFPNEVDNAWGWQQVGGEIIWSQAISAANVCLIDTGVDTAHPEFASLTLPGYDYVNGDTTPNDDNGHGTHLAGIIMAKANNGAGTAIGIASTKLVPVKAANAQGWGTSFNISAALRFCAGQTTVKVINLALTSPNPDSLVYSSIAYAIGKSKLVVVAAGNDSESYVSMGNNTWRPASFPGGWATKNVGVDGLYYATAPTGNNANTIYSGLISVAAARDPSLSTWVDTELDPEADINTYRTIQDDELHANCATEFSNYGNWVTLVAPGGNIYSTTPVSYPFYLNYQYGVPANYGVMSGTSQAAAFVSGAASRVWGVYASMTPGQVKTRLVVSGTALDQVIDLGNSSPLNPNIGFANASNFTFPYGTPFNSFTLDESQTADTVIAPFCWPTADAPFSTLQDMSGAAYLNVASAMNRVAFWVTALEGTSGMPLAGAAVRALYGTSSTTVKASATVPAGLTRDLPNAALINVPLDNDSAFNAKATTFRLQISKTGYTNTNQTFDMIDVDPGLVGTFITDPYSRVSLLPSTIIQAVVDWNAPQDFNYGDPDATFPDLSAVLFLPNAAASNNGAVVGPAAMPAGITNVNGKYLDAGTLLSPTTICGTANCTFSPYAQYQFDGGMENGTDSSGNRMFSATEESISIASGGALTASPYLKPFFTTGVYTLMVTANDVSFLQGGDISVIPVPIYPIVRVWSKGNLIGSYKLEDANSTCDGTTHAWWKVASLSSSNPVGINTCGSAPAFFPYTP